MFQIWSIFEIGERKGEGGGLKKDRNTIVAEFFVCLEDLLFSFLFYTGAAKILN